MLPRKEQSRAESYTPGDRVRTVIKGVNRSAKGPQIVLSRTDPALLIKLFEQEVPEIYDGTVMIRGAVREAGDRAKVAVFSRERDVDPVGACVGMKGTRVQSIIRELRGEKIDIVEWSEDPIAFVTNALSPAKVQRVSIVDDRERVMEVIVEDKQLSLAIGKKGQNVRLAAKLTGWRIDIKSEEEKRREVEAQFEGLEIRDGRGTEERRGGRQPTSGRERGRTEEAVAAPEASDVPVPYTLAGIGEKTVRKLVDGGSATRIEARGRGHRRAAVGDSRHRREDGREDSGRRARRSAPAEATPRRRRMTTRRTSMPRRRDACALALLQIEVHGLATVRIFKVAELLGTTSQEVTALLKRDHGIEVKSASSTIEEVVARQFVERLARQRNISLPSGDIFAETPVAKGKKPAPAKKAAEPASRRRRRCRRRAWSRRPSRWPPRQSSSPNPSPPSRSRSKRPRRPSRRRRRRLPVAEAPSVACAAVGRTTPLRAAAPAAPPAPAAEAPAAARRRGRTGDRTAGASPEAAGSRPRRAADAAAAHRRTASDDADAAAADIGRRRGPCSGRSRRRSRPRRRRPRARRRAVPTRRARARVRPLPRRVRVPARPASDRRIQDRGRKAPVGGPRPLPSQPVRTQQPGMPPRPGQQYPQRPGMPSRPSYQQRPGGQGRPAAGAAARTRASRAAADARRAAAGHAHDHARRRHDGEGSRRQARPARQGRAREAADEAADADHQLARSTPKPRR